MCLHAALQGGVRPAPPSPQARSSLSVEGLGPASPGQRAPSLEFLPQASPQGSPESGAPVCGSQDREESQAEVGDKLERIDKLPPKAHRSCAEGGAGAWGGCPQLPQSELVSSHP